MARVLVPEKIADAGLDALRAAGHDVDVQLGLSPEELVEAVEGAQALIIRSATTVTRAAPRRSPARRAASSQRMLWRPSKARCRRLARPPSVRSRNCASSAPSTAPLVASTAIIACRKLPWPPAEPRVAVVSCTARMSRPAQAACVRPKAVATISPIVTDGLRRNRVKRISPARSPPRRRTRTPPVPCATSRSRRSAPLFPDAGPRTCPSPSRPPFSRRESRIPPPRKRDV